MTRKQRQELRDTLRRLLEAHGVAGVLQELTDAAIESGWLRADRQFGVEEGNRLRRRVTSH
jgi:hypothetical protein